MQAPCTLLTHWFPSSLSTVLQILETLSQLAQYARDAQRLAAKQLLDFKDGSTYSTRV